MYMLKQIVRRVREEPQLKCIDHVYKSGLFTRDNYKFVFPLIQGMAPTKSSSKDNEMQMGYALDTDETQVEERSLACDQHRMVWNSCFCNYNKNSGPGMDDDDVMIVEPHQNPLEIESSEAGILHRHVYLL